jgi:hypothetical protein
MYRATADLIVHLLATRAIRVGCSVAVPVVFMVCDWGDAGEELGDDDGGLGRLFEKEQVSAAGHDVAFGRRGCSGRGPVRNEVNARVDRVGLRCLLRAGSVVVRLFAQPVQGADLRSHRPALAATTVVASSSSNASRERRTASRRRLVRDLAQASMARSKRLTCTGSATPRG